MRKDILEREDEIKQWVAEKRPKLFMCKELKCKPDTLNAYLDKMGIIYHGNQGRKGIEAK